MVRIPLSIRTIVGLNIVETKVLVFIVQEHARIKAAKTDPTKVTPQELATNHVTKHIRKKHSETMKVINRLRKFGYVQLTERQSGGNCGNGYDGQLFGELTPSQSAVELVARYFQDC